MMGGEGGEERKRKKKKKKKRDASSSSSSSSSGPDEDAVAQWQAMWQKWQQGMGQGMGQGQWPGTMPGGGAPQPQGGQPWGHPGHWPQPQTWPQPPGAPAEQQFGHQGSSSSSSHHLHGRGGGGGGGGWGGEEPEEAVAEDEEVPIFLEPSVEEEVAVPKALLGKVIGKQAQTIIEIREKSGAFKVDARDQTSDPCMVKIAGTAEAVRKARALIMELVDSTKAKHISSHYVEIPKSKIGMVIGLKGAQVNEIQGETNTKIDVEFDSDPCKCYIKGELPNVERAKKILLTIAMQIEDEASEYLDFPKTVSGALIGAQGSRVRDFQEQSGARIDIDKSGDRCKVRLTGTKEAVSIAKHLIMAELEKTGQNQNKPAAPLLNMAPQQMIVPAHQPTSFPATLSESIARAKAAAEAVKHGLIGGPGGGGGGFGGGCGFGMDQPEQWPPPQQLGGQGQWGQGW